VRGRVAPELVNGRVAPDQTLRQCQHRAERRRMSVLRDPAPYVIEVRWGDVPQRLGGQQDIAQRAAPVGM